MKDLRRVFGKCREFPGNQVLTWRKFRAFQGWIHVWLSGGFRAAEAAGWIVLVHSPFLSFLPVKGTEIRLVRTRRSVSVGVRG